MMNLSRRGRQGGARGPAWESDGKLETQSMGYLHLGGIEYAGLAIAAYIEILQRRLAAPSEQHLAAIRMLFGWLVVDQVIAANPASPVRGPRHSVKKGKTSVHSAAEARALLDSIRRNDDVSLDEVEKIVI